MGLGKPELEYLHALVQCFGATDVQTTTLTIVCICMYVCMYYCISTSRVKITNYIYENQVKIPQYKSVLDVIANDKPLYLKKLNTLAFQP